MSLGRIDWTKDEHGVNLICNRLLNKIAEKHSVTSAQVLLRYQLQRGILVIPKRNELKYDKIQS